MAHRATDRYLQVVAPTPDSTVAGNATTAACLPGALFDEDFLLAAGAAFFAVAFFTEAVLVADVFALTGFLAVAFFATTFLGAVFPRA